MALQKYQYPGDLPSGGQWAHQNTYNEWYTVVSDEYDLYTDFKYKFNIYTVDGMLGSPNKQIARKKEGVGRFNPNPILKQQFYPEFKHDITTYTPKGGSILNYYIEVEESSKDIASPDTQEYDKHICIRNWREDFNYEDYLMKGATNNFPSKFFNNHTANRQIQLTDYSTLRCLSGVIKAGSSVYRSYFYTLKIRVKKRNDNVIYDYYFNTPNPYYTSTSSQPAGNTLADLSNYLLEIPSGAANLNGLKYSYKYWLSGSLIDSGYISSDIITSDVEYYDVTTFTWPIGGDGVTSEPVRYEITDYCNYSPLRIYFENDLGGFDDINFNLVSSKNINVNHSTFRKERDTQGGLPGIKYGNNKYIGHSDTDGGESVYHTSVDEYYVGGIDFLSDEQIRDIEPLWSSQNVFAEINGNIYPVISTIKKRKIVSTQNEERNYDIQFKLSNKKLIN